MGQARLQLADPTAPHSHIDKPRGTEEEGSKPRNPGLQRGEIKPQTSDCARGGLGGSRRDSQPHRRGRWRDPQGPRVCTGPPTWESAPEGPSLIVGSGGSDWNPVEGRAGTSAPSQPLPHVQHHSAATSNTCPWWTPKALPLYITGAPRPKKRPKWKNRLKLQKKYN